MGYLKNMLTKKDIKLEERRNDIAPKIFKEMAEEQVKDSRKKITDQLLEDEEK